MSTVLAIEAGTSGRDEATERGAQLLDSLSYVDPLSDAEKRKAEALIDEETKRSPRRVTDYLQRMGDMPSLDFPDGSGCIASNVCLHHRAPWASPGSNNPILKNEFVRIAAREPMAQIDQRRFELPEPRLQERDDTAAWKAAADNAAAQLEHQLNRIMNLELALKHAPNVWRAHNARTSAIAGQLERQSEALGAEITKINQRRKLQQRKAAEELDMQTAVYYGLTRKNVEIEVACQSLLAEAERLEARAALHAPAAAAAAAPNGVPALAANGSAVPAQGGAAAAPEAGAGPGESAAAVGAAEGAAAPADAAPAGAPEASALGDGDASAEAAGDGATADADVQGDAMVE